MSKRVWAATACLVGAAGLAGLRADNGHDDHQSAGRGAGRAGQVVTVAFGAGLNTTGAANHHVLPRTIEVRKGGVVNFVVAGFHQIFVYVPGIKPEEVIANAPAWPPPPGPVSPSVLFVNYGLPADPANPKLFYVGLNPGIALPPPLPPMAPLSNPLQGPNPPVYSNAFNRVEPVAFPEEGRFLVICNINPHLRDGMWAWVKVTR
jgi:hypothetical protein